MPVLCLRRGGLGDTLLMLPVLQALRRRHPTAPLHFAGDAEFAAVLQRFGAVDRALSSEDLQLWALRGDGDMAAVARSRLRGFSHIVADDAAVLAVAGDGVEVKVFDPAPQRFDRPLAEQLLARLHLDASASAALLPSRPLLAADAVVALAPGSGAPQKCWPRPRWLELAARLAAAGRRLGVVVGPAERERDRPDCWPWPAGTEIVADRSATEVSLWLATARAFVGNDSGTTHLAAALLLPTIAIFGPGWPEVYAPQGAHVRVLRGRPGSPPDVGVDAVSAALAALPR